MCSSQLFPFFHRSSSFNLNIQLSIDIYPKSHFKLIFIVGQALLYIASFYAKIASFKEKDASSRLVMCLGQIFLILVGSAIYGLSLGLENFP